MTPGHFPSDHDDVAGRTLPAWMGEALRAPVTSRPEARARIMQQVRALPAPRRLSVPLAQRTARWRRRGSLTGLGGAMLTALLTMAVGLRQADQRALAQRLRPAVIVVGDSAIPVRGADSLAAIMSGRLLDTMKVVEYVVQGRDVRSARVQHAIRDTRGPETAGRASRRAPFEPAQLLRVSDGEWRVRALLPRDAVAVAFQVNDVVLDPVALPGISGM